MADNIAEQLEFLSPTVMRDLILNPSANPDYKVAAAYKLVRMRHKYARMPEVQHIVAPVEGYGCPTDEDGMPLLKRPDPSEIAPFPEAETLRERIVREKQEPVLADEVPEPDEGPFRASVTTQTMRVAETVSKPSESEGFDEENISGDESRGDGVEID